MELWVRSQDRNNLKKVNNIYVEEITRDYDSWVGNIHSQPYVITSDNGNLGFYATKERALEILDEIQNILIIKNSFNLSEEIINKCFENNTEEEIQKIVKTLAVYEMPEE